MNCCMLYLCLVGLILKSNSSKVEEDGIFEQIHTIIFNTQGKNNSIHIENCPVGSKVYNDNGVYKCITCKNGATSKTINSPKCTKCLPNFKKILKEDGDSFECKECEIGSLPLPTSADSSSKTCVETECDSSEYYSLDSNQCIKCSATLKNSIGRPEGSPPLEEYCSCPNKSIKITKNGISNECLMNSDYDPDIIDDLNKISLARIKFGYHKFFNDDKTIRLSFFNCSPYDRPIVKEYDCGCNKGFLFYNNKCRSCLKLNERMINLPDCISAANYRTREEEPSKHIENRLDLGKNKDKCKQCPNNSVCSNQKSECLCLKDFEFKENECVKCLEGQHKDIVGNSKCIDNSKNSNNSKIDKLIDQKLNIGYTAVLIFGILLAVVCVFNLIIWIIIIIYKRYNKKLSRKARKARNARNNYQENQDNLFNVYKQTLL